MTPSPFMLVKECKGAALAILVLLSANRQMGGGPVAQEWLERHSGYTDKPIRQSLAYLCETGRIVQTRLGWVLAEGAELALFSMSLPSSGRGIRLRHKPRSGSGRQGPGGGGEAPGGTPMPGLAAQIAPLEQVEPEDGSTLPVERRQQPQPHPTRHNAQLPNPGQRTPSRSRKLSALSRNNSDSSRNYSDSPTTTTAKDLNLNTDPAEEEGQKTGVIPTHADLEHIQANLAAFKNWGVGRNEKTILLARRPEVTPGQIDAVARRLIEERRFSTGLLITAVQCGDQPVPNPRGVRPSARDPCRYADWEQ